MEPQLEEKSGVRLAIEGCGHGTLHAIYASVTEACTHKNWPGVDLLIIGGDFQAVRNAYDLNCVSMPAKYRSMCDFHEYYSGQRTAPYLTIFVGGNHEASNYLFELYYGGWVAPNIYYMGVANVLRFGPLRIAALSGIWKGYSYRKPHHERLPYNESDLKSIYHVRELDVRKLLQIRTQIDIGISHDWPKGVEWKGNWKQLFRFKKHLEDDARNGQLGSVAAKQVLDWLRPAYWFGAHLHCKYAAVIDYGGKGVAQNAPPSVDSRPAKNEDEIDLDEELNGDDSIANGSAPQNENEIDLDLDLESEAAPTSHDTSEAPAATKMDRIDLELEDDTNGVAPVAPGQGLDSVHVPAEPACATQALVLSLEEARAALPKAFRSPAAPEQIERPAEIINKTTNFLALDKCLPGKHFLQLTSIPTEVDLDNKRPLKLEYDREWLSITGVFAREEPLQLGDHGAHVSQAKTHAEYESLVGDQRIWVDGCLDDLDLVIPENFEVTAPVYDGGDWTLPQYSQVIEYPNPQTACFCELLSIPNPFDISEEERQSRLVAGPRPDPDAERPKAGRGRGGFGHGRGRGASGGRGRGGRGGRGRGRGQFRGRWNH